MERPKRAHQAPALREQRSIEDHLAELNARLQNEFFIGPLGAFTVVVEGRTDVRYLSRAAELARADGEDLLSVPVDIYGSGQKISIVTPGKPEAPNKGGVPRMVDLAEALTPLFRLNVLGSVLFVFDNDNAGANGISGVGRYGFQKGTHVLTIDPQDRPPDVNWVVEDLLSLDVQERFFRLGGAWCDISYEAGVLRRFRWRRESKDSLCDFVCRQGSREDFAELLALLRRVRQTFGLPV